MSENICLNFHNVLVVERVTASGKELEQYNPGSPWVKLDARLLKLNLLFARVLNAHYRAASHILLMPHALQILDILQITQNEELPIAANHIFN